MIWPACGRTEYGDDHHIPVLNDENGLQPSFEAGKGSDAQKHANMYA